jgi:hypothetical protein
MKKVAVVMHGQLRHWDESSKVLALWNSIFDDIEFDFFLATWKEENENIEKNLKLKDYRLYTKEDMYSIMQPPLRFYFKNIKQARPIPSYQHYYSFLVSKAVDLFKDYTSTNDYKAVLLVRPDVFTYFSTLNFIKKKLNFNADGESNNTVEFGSKIVYSRSGSTYNQNRLFCNSDTMFLGSVDSISSFGEIYYDIFSKQIFPPKSLHSLQAEYLNWKRIYHSKNAELTHNLIRTRENSKPGYPTPEGIQECISTYPTSIYDPDNHKAVIEIFKKYT